MARSMQEARISRARRRPKTRLQNRTPTANSISHSRLGGNPKGQRHAPLAVVLAVVVTVTVAFEVLVPSSVTEAGFTVHEVVGGAPAQDKLTV